MNFQKTTSIVRPGRALLTLCKLAPPRERCGRAHARGACPVGGRGGIADQQVKVDGRHGQEQGAHPRAQLPLPLPLRSEGAPHDHEQVEIRAGACLPPGPGSRTGSVHQTRDPGDPRNSAPEARASEARTRLHPGAGSRPTHATSDRLALGGGHPADASSAQGDGHQQRRLDSESNELGMAGAEGDHCIVGAELWLGLSG